MDNKVFRNIIDIAQFYAYDYLDDAERVSEQLNESAQVETPKQPILNEVVRGELESMIFKLKSFQESESGEYGYGFEAGMQRAANMIENLISKLDEEDK